MCTKVLKLIGKLRGEGLGAPCLREDEQEGTETVATRLSLMALTGEACGLGRHQEESSGVDGGQDAVVPWQDENLPGRWLRGGPALSEEVSLLRSTWWGHVSENAPCLTHRLPSSQHES